MTTRSQMNDATIMLVDNGSTRADAARQLREIAHNLSNSTSLKIHAVSLKHSDRIKAEDVEQKLSGIKARVFTEFVTEQLKKGKREFILVPLFFGKSRALTSFVPDEKEKLESQFGEFTLSMADVLYPLDEGSPILVDILYEHATKAANGNTKEALKNLVLVDHGSPIQQVNAVRQGLAASLNKKMPQGLPIHQAAMERRKGSEYDFNGELLENYLQRLAESGEKTATVLLQFLLSGTHAGKDGDIVQICNAVMAAHPEFKVSISPLIGENEKLVNLLAEKLNKHLSK